MSSVPVVNLRDAIDADAVAINELYNATVPTTTVAWTEELVSLAARHAWMHEQQQVGNPILVADVEGQIAGFASYDDFRNSVKWPGYRFTVEHTIHVGADAQGIGIGSALLRLLLERATAAGNHVMIGAIDGGNEGSIRFHARHGFVEVARLPEVGFKFGRWLDLVLMQRTLT
jgi:L-amino acid N-acyltransferase YncA